VRFIGDIHGDVLKYAQLISDCDESVQIGDFGIGFLPEYGLVDSLHESGNHRFIRGNHDDPALCKERPGYIEDNTVDVERGIMYTGGAWSIDWVGRVARMDRGYPTCWWKDEELDMGGLLRAHALYVHHMPRIMVTHDCPTSVAYQMFIGGYGKKQFKTRTADAYDVMFHRHKPDIWLFGHWHEDVDMYINGTRFICLGINSYIDLEV
jgi:predicted phosphodiesterase